MTRVLRVTDWGYSNCQNCGRHIPLLDEVAETVCPFCDHALLDETDTPPIGTLAHLATLPGRAGVLCRALRDHAPDTPNPATYRDPSLTGDPTEMPRNIGLDEIENVRSPRHAVWELTLACDLKCLHCGSRAGQKRTAELSTQECFDLIAEMADLGIREVTLIGGEAYMRRDWHLIAAEIVRQGIGCSMTTGGRSLDDRRVGQAVDAGIGAIGVSIDGLEYVHDSLRGVNGSWRKAIEASERIAASPMRLSTNTQVNRFSAPELAGIARIMDAVGSASWQIQLTVAMGNAVDHPELLLQPDDLLEIFPLLVWTKENILSPAGIALIMGNNVGYYSPFEPALRYGGDLGLHWTGCSAGQQVLGIEADGKVKGCPSLATQDFTGGVAGQTPLDQIVQNAPEIADFATRGRESLTGYCQSCQYADMCRAGCSWTAHSLLGRLGDNPFCIHRAMERERIGKREVITKTSDAPGLPFDIGTFDLTLDDKKPCDTPPSVVGVPLEDVIGIGPWDGGHLSADALRAYLKPPRMSAVEKLRVQAAEASSD